MESSSTQISGWKYDVFLNFRGEDTRKNFTDHLYAALVRAGINTFRDDNELEIGEEIRQGLLKAIEESRFSIIVLSKNYASSTWCLDELEHMLACRRTLGHAVWPIFYDIDPSDIRKQKRSFAEAFREHEERFKDHMDKVTRWRVALREVAKLKGLDLRKEADGHESKNIDYIVKEILNRLHRTKLSVALHPVGLRYGAKEVTFMLFNGSLDVGIVGIYGIGGIGKTTIAKEVYNLISHNFQASCFLADVRENCDPKDMVQLQRQLLSETVMGKHEEIYNVHRGLKVIEGRLRHKRVLIILDDVDELHQLNQILGDRSWLFPGSRIIITTRIKDLLKPSRLYQQYEVDRLTNKDSLQLLSLHAFDTVHPIEDYMECAQSVVRYAGGIPLVLEVLGSSLSGEHVDVWNSTLEKLKVISNKDIHSRLKISYDSLDHVEKSLFLDIACFFVGFDKDYVISILDDCGFFPIAGINKLMKRCLIRNDFGNKFMMHDLLRDMGREIIRQESPAEPGNRSRLWHHADAIDVLTNKTGTKKIEGLIVNLPRQSEKWSTKAFEKMNRLRLLQLNYVCLTGSFGNFPRKLRWLCWHRFPLETIPVDIHLGNLVSLDMQYSKLKHFQGDAMYLRKLKFLDLSHSHDLTKICNFESFPNLEVLSLESCFSLVELHDSITVLTRLHSLNLQDCMNLRNLPKSIEKLRSLKNLNISGCSEAIRNLENLERSFYLCELRPTASPRKGPSIISLLLPSLKELDLSYCNLSDDMIPHALGGLTLLETLKLSGNNFFHLPASIGSLPKLGQLWLCECKRLQSVPEFSSSLWELKAEDCLSLESINLVNFQKYGDFRVKRCINLKIVEGYCNLEPLRVEIVEKLLRDRGLFTPESIASARMLMFNNLTDSTCISHLQALYEGGIYSIFLPLTEIPSWFSHQSRGNKISLHMPALKQGCKIIGFIICVVYVPISSNFTDRGYSSISIRTKKFNLLYKPLAKFRNVVPQDVVWLSHWAFENMNEMIDKSWRFQDVIEEGDQVKVLISMGFDIRVKRCGIHLLYGHNDQGSQSNDLTTISYASRRHIKKRSFSDYDVEQIPEYPIFIWCLDLPGDLFGSWRTYSWNEFKVSVLGLEEESGSVDDEEESLTSYDEEGEPECMIQKEECIFSRIWAIDAPGKMKHFLCRCLDGIVTLQELFDECCFCAETETLDHLLLQCPFAQAVWLSSPLQLYLRVVAPASFMDWLLDLSDLWKQDDEYRNDKWRLVAFTVWMIWKARNDLLYKAIKWDPISISYKVMDNVSEFIATSREGSKIDMNTMIDDDYQGRNRWMKPPFNVFKLNVHASWIKEWRCGSVGAIIRDNYGMFVAAMSKQFNYITSVRSAEAKAVLEALQFCDDFHLNRLIVEGDCKDVLEIFKFEKDDVELAAYVEDVCTLAKHVFVVDFNFVRTELNCVAQRLASHGCYVEDFELWLEDPPAWLEPTLNADW